MDMKFMLLRAGKKEGPSPEVTLLELPDKKVNTQKNAEAIIDVIQSLSIDIFVLPGFLWNYLGFVQKQVLCKICIYTS